MNDCPAAVKANAASGWDARMAFRAMIQALSSAVSFAKKRIAGRHELVLCNQM